MNLIAVDDEYHALKALERAIREALPNALIQTFESADEALYYTQSHTVDVAFLDIELPGAGGLVLAQNLMELCPSINIIFVSGYTEYALDAFALHASGYLNKPVGPEDILAEMAHLRTPLLSELESESPRVTVKTFGNFEVFVDERPLEFSRNKSKEVLAYLVDRRGSGVTLKELAAILWEEGGYDRGRQYQIQTFITALLADLESEGIRDIVIRRRNFLAIDISKINCDLYRYLAGNKEAIQSYLGEYMVKYGWAEPTAAMLSQRRNQQQYC